MKKMFFIAALAATTSSFAQGLVPFVDFNKWFRVVKNGQPAVVDMQEIKGFKGGDNLVAYIDIRGNLRVYDGTSRHDISNMNLEYQISDNILAWKIGQTLGVWQNGVTKYISYFAGTYVVKDDIVVYTDTRFNSIMVYYNGVDYPVQTSTTDIFLQNSEMIGENIMAYPDNGGLYRIFYKGQLHEVGVWNGKIDIKSGTDIVAFNDPNTRTFAVFDKGNFVDVEEQWVKRFKVGRNFVVYEDVSGDLKMYRNGNVTRLTGFPGVWDVVDDIVMYEDNGFTYVNVNGTKTMAANYKVSEYKLKNAVMVFKNVIGGVSAVVDGKVVELTTQQNTSFDIFGNDVLVNQFNQSFIVFSKGKRFEF